MPIKGRPNKRTEDRATARIELMIKPKDKELLRTAAQLSGILLSAFVKQAAIRTAYDTIALHKELK